jgi:tetratricopeptide (TPR) repeat protein
MGQLQHPGIPPVHDLGQLPDGRPFLAMKLIEGQTLAQLLREHRASGETRKVQASLIPATEAARPDARLLAIFEQICQTLAYAHARGVIHRDLKPANVMVGAFSEVQVMDWGLAKRMAGHTAPLADSENRPPEAFPENLPSARFGVPLTVPGSVMGTPAYMAPEQARGEVDKLDARCDVFGLGAILCELLTDMPPYTGRDGTEAFRKAQAADLTEARERLDRCGAAAELIALARRCLEPDLSQRLRDASDVAAAVAAYVQSVQARLKQAELERARATVQAAAEQKRRLVERQKHRVTLAAVALLLLLVIGGSIAGLWYQAEEAKKEARQRSGEMEVSDALRKTDEQWHQLHDKLADSKKVSELLSNPDSWRKLLDGAEAAWGRADTVTRSDAELFSTALRDQVAERKVKLEDDKEDFRRAMLLDAIHLRAAEPVDGEWSTEAPLKEYPPLFAAWGMDPLGDKAAVVADKMRKSPLRFVLVAALDEWALAGWYNAKERDQLLEKLLVVARLADPDPWRDQLRDPMTWKDVKKLRALASKVELDKQTPQILILLAWRLYHEGAKVEGKKLMREALASHLQDFWLHFWLAGMEGMEDDLKLSASCYRAALAVRPNSHPAHFNLANTLSKLGDLSEAITHYRKAIELEDKIGRYYNNLGTALRAAKDFDGAIAAYENAIRLGPKSKLPAYHHNLGMVFEVKKDPAAALAQYQKAIALDNKYAPAYHSLGQVLHQKKDLDGAIAAFNKAIAINPQNAEAYGDLGLALSDQKNLNGAIAAYNEAIKINPQNADVYCNLGNALFAKEDMPAAIAAYKKAIEINPQFGKVYNNLGNALSRQQDLPGAIAAYKKAIEINPQYVGAYNNLGNALAAQKDLPAAIAAYKKALEINPQFALAYENLGITYVGQKDFKGAIYHFQKAVDLVPEDPSYQSNLGKALLFSGAADAAIPCYKKALTLNPNYPKANFYLGHAYFTRKNWDEAIAAFEKELALDPKSFETHYGLGNALKKKGDLVGAIAQYHATLKLAPNYALAHGDLAWALQQQGKFAEALKSFQQVHALGSKQPGWKYPTAQWIKDCERLVQLDEQWPALKKGEIKPKDAAEKAEFANLCYYKKLYKDAVDLYVEILTAEPMLAAKYRYEAATTAALGGTDVNSSNQEEKAKLRQKALSWLQAELALLTSQIKTDPKAAAKVQKTLAWWQQDTDLASVRDPNQLGQLPELERKGWQQLWADVDALLKKVQKSGPG